MQHAAAARGPHAGAALAIDGAAAHGEKGDRRRKKIELRRYNG